MLRSSAGGGVGSQVGTCAGELDQGNCVCPWVPVQWTQLQASMPHCQKTELGNSCICRPRDVGYEGGKTTEGVYSK